MSISKKSAGNNAATKRYKEKYDAIVAAAATRFNQAGFAGATINDIASDVGLIKNSVTYYFKRKEDLVLACYMRAIDVYNEIIAHATTRPTVPERINQLVRSYVELETRIAQGDSPDVISFVEGRGLPEPYRNQVFESYTNMFLNLRALLRDKETEKWRRASLNARTHLLLSQINGIKWLVPNYQPEDHERLIGQFSDIIIYGVQSNSESWSCDDSELELLVKNHQSEPNSRFLRAAAEVINDNGYAGASVNRISNKLSLTKGGFYYYNEKKEDLAVKCFDHFVSTFRNAMNLSEHTSNSGWSHLRSFVRGLVAFQLSDEGPLLRASSSTIFPDSSYQIQVGEELRRINQRISGVVLRGLADGSIRTVDPGLVAHIVRLGITSAAELSRWVKPVDEKSAPLIFGQPLLMGLLCPDDEYTHTGKAARGAVVRVQ